MPPHKSNRIKILTVVFAAMLCCSTNGFRMLAHAEHDTSPKDFTTFDIKSDSQFASYKTAVADYAKAKHSKTANDFCVLGYLTGDNLKNAFVIWKQGRQIIVWYGGDQSLADSQRIINLRSDVVPTEDDLHGSTYLVTKAWVAEVTTTCNSDGVKVHVPKS